MSATWVALLRGINVGHAKRIAMADLRSSFISLGSTNVRTHGQSGNVIFESSERQAASLEQAISAAIRADFGMEVAVLVRSARDFVTVIDANPFVARGIATSELHVAFLSAEPAASKIASVDQSALLPDEFAFGTRAVYVRLPNGVMGSTLPDWDRVLGVRATQRNWSTATKLRDLVS